MGEADVTSLAMWGVITMAVMCVTGLSYLAYRSRNASPSS